MRLAVQADKEKMKGISERAHTATSPSVRSLLIVVDVKAEKGV